MFISSLANYQWLISRVRVKSLNKLTLIPAKKERQLVNVTTNLGLRRELTTWMPSNSPANIIKFIRAFRSVWEVSGRVPGFRIGVDTFIPVSVGDVIKLVDVSNSISLTASW